jgi:hypothetical protein
LINGSASEFLSLSRKLIKGCPLFPLLFLLAIEGLSMIIESCKRNGKLKGVQIERGLSISHILFVDDVLFGAGSIREA